MSPPFSVSNNKLSKKPAWKVVQILLCSYSTMYLSTVHDFSFARQPCSCLFAIFLIRHFARNIVLSSTRCWCLWKCSIQSVLISIPVTVTNTKSKRRTIQPCVTIQTVNVIKAKVTETHEKFSLAQWTVLYTESFNFRVIDYIATDL
jgi:hypothetical protein